MVSPDGGAGPIAAKVGIEVFKMVAPGGVAGAWQWLKTKTFGRRLLVVGNAQSGKTSFINAMRYGTLIAEQAVAPTDLENLFKPAKVTLKLGDTGNLELRLKAIHDMIGQTSPKDQAITAVKVRPHALVIMTSLADPDRRSWLESFLTDWVAKVQRPKNKPANKALKSVIVILNKVDKSTKKDLAAATKDTKAAIEKHLRPLLGSNATSVPTLPSITVEHDDAMRYLTQIFKVLAHELARE